MDLKLTQISDKQKNEQKKRVQIEYDENHNPT